MMKKVEVVGDHKEAERRILENSFMRTPEERIAWLMNQIQLMNKLNPLRKKSSGYKLPLKHG